MRHLCIGTSGWNYPHWRGVFYPPGLAQSRWLEYYAGAFNSVELNVTFYRLLKRQTFEGWRQRTPEGFRFVVKGSRFITHVKKLHSAAEPLTLLIENARGLGEKLAAFLWQLPPTLKKDLKRLEAFLESLRNTGIRQAFEFRNESWFDAETYALLEAYNACLCIADSARFPSAREVTADFVYLRFHGRAGLYSSSYSEGELKEWAEFAAGCARSGLFAFFNNDAHGYAVKDAAAFRELVCQRLR